MTIRLTVPRRKRSVLIALAILAIAITSVAYAAWLVTSTGGAVKGAGGTLTAPVISMSVNPPATGGAYPGSNSALNISATNPGSVPLKLVSISGTPTLSSDDETACPKANWSWVNVVLTTPLIIPAGTVTSTTFTIPTSSMGAGQGLNLAASAPNGCQGEGLYAASPSFSFGFST